MVALSGVLVAMVVWYLCCGARLVRFVFGLVIMVLILLIVLFIVVDLLYLYCWLLVLVCIDLDVWFVGLNCCVSVVCFACWGVCVWFDLVLFFFGFGFVCGVLVLFVFAGLLVGC